MSIDLYDYTQPDPRCTCHPVHGNADDDGICNFCRPRLEALPRCEDCETTENVSPDLDVFDRPTGTYRCEPCEDKRRERSVSGEDYGSTRHELQDAYGGWRR